MLRAVVVLFVIGGISAWSQSQKDAPSGAVKVDKATAYYHYMLAHMYAEMAYAYGIRNPEYAEKVTENLKLAIKADPQSALLVEELARGGRVRRYSGSGSIYRATPPPAK